MAKTGIRVRKQFSYVMTTEDRFALQTVQRAQAALKTINEAIKSGKPVDGNLVDLCFQMSQAAGRMLFAKQS